MGVTEVQFRCPACHADLPSYSDGEAWACLACGKQVMVIDGIPLLVCDYARIEGMIADAQAAGRGEWYEDVQTRQLTGPYRHHVRKRRQYVQKVITDYVDQRGMQLAGLDLGCGDGVNTPWLANLMETVYASDYNLVRLQRARHNNNAKMTFLADILDYPVQDGGFDVIFFNHVLEHIPDDADALREVYRILKPGGLLVLGVPNEGAAFWRLAYRLQPRIRATSDHVHFYTAGDLSAKCEEAGFAIQEVHPIGWGVPHWTLDAVLRQWKWVDNMFECLGRAIAPSQATSLYLILTK